MAFPEALKMASLTASQSVPVGKSWSSSLLWWGCPLDQLDPATRHWAVSALDPLALQKRDRF